VKQTAVGTWTAVVTSVSYYEALAGTLQLDKTAESHNGEGTLVMRFTMPQNRANSQRMQITVNGGTTYDPLPGSVSGGGCTWQVSMDEGNGSAAGTVSVPSYRGDPKTIQLNYSGVTMGDLTMVVNAIGPFPGAVQQPDGTHLGTGGGRAECYASAVITLADK